MIQQSDNSPVNRLQKMSGIEKAATILNVLDKPLAGRLLALFAPSDLKKITELAGNLEPISSTDFSSLIEEFAGKFSENLQMLGDGRDVTGLLENVLTPEQVAEIDAEEAVTSTVPVWNNDTFAKEEVLLPIFHQEHPQVIAFLLTKLTSELSAALISKLSDSQRNDVMFRMLEIQPVRTEIMGILEDHFRCTFVEGDLSARNKATLSRVATVINNLEKSYADDFLDDLSGKAPSEAKELKKLLFSFEDLPQLSAKDRLVLFDNVPTDVSIVALHEADEILKELVLSSFGGRVRKMVESELSNVSDRDPKEVTQARQKIATTVLELADAGEISITIEEDDE